MHRLRLGLTGAACLTSFYLNRRHAHERRSALRCDASRRAPESCTSHVCSSKMDMLNKSMTAATKGYASSPPSVQRIPQPSSEESGAKGVMTSKCCPVDKDELGRSTWALLHTLAAYYPHNPSEDDKKNAMSIIVGLSQLYPCSICVDDFKESVKASPPDVSSRTAFSLWVCRLHNEVNEKVGHPTFDCDMSKLDERWKTGHEACNLK